MFCPKCGNKVKEDAVFCENCGAKVYENVGHQTSMQHLPGGNRKTVDAVTPLTAGDSSIDSVEMVVSIEKVEGRAYAKIKSPVVVDNIKIGEVPNGETATYKISSGQHCIKIGAVCIWVDIPQGNAFINLNFKWGPKVKPEIVCQQERFVTRSSEMDSNVERQIGLEYAPACALMGFFVPLVGVILFFSLKKTYPKVAKIAGFSALVGGVIYIIFRIFISLS